MGSQSLHRAPTPRRSSFDSNGARFRRFHASAGLAGRRGARSVRSFWRSLYQERTLSAEVASGSVRAAARHAASGGPSARRHAGGAPPLPSYRPLPLPLRYTRLPLLRARRARRACLATPPRPAASRARRAFPPAFRSLPENSYSAMIIKLDT